MRRVDKPTDPHHQRTEPTPAENEPARFLRNLTSLPDTDFASVYSPAIAAVFARYGDLPDPGAARRSLLLALKAGLKRRRAFILPRFTQAEDSWRIRECASYAVAIAILVDHACALLAPDGADRPTDPAVWLRILASPEIAPEPDGPSPHCTFFHAIVPAQGRRWIAREPLVQTLIANYFTATAPNELHEIVGPVVAGFANDRQVRPLLPTDDRQPPPSDVHDLSSSSRERRTGLLIRTLARTSRALRSERRGPKTVSDRPPSTSPISQPTRSNPRQPHNTIPSPKAEARAPDGSTNRPLGTPRPSSTPATNDPPPKPLPTGSPLSSAAISHGQPSRSKPSQNRRARARVADILDGLPTTPGPRTSPTRDAPKAPPARRPDIGEHAATTARVGHAADYARNLAADNALRSMGHTGEMRFPGPAPSISGNLLDIGALFPGKADTAHIEPHAIAAWIAFRDHLVEGLRDGTQTANGERSLVHLLEVGAFLVWPQVALPFADESGVTPVAIKSAMRVARVLAVNRADRQDEKHAFPALTGDPDVTCHGVITLPEFLWPDPAHRPARPSAFVRPPAIYGQRYRRPH